MTTGSAPVARRPNFPSGYGIPTTEEGTLPWTWAVERLERSRNYWIVTAKADGMPHAAPVWGVWLDNAVVFGTSADSRKGRNLARDPRVVVHLESGNEVVIVEGEAEELPLDDRLADAYGAKYQYRPTPGNPEGLWLRVRPRVAYSWLESDYPRTATRFSFG